MSETVAVILAAGKGVRLGGPKALLLWPGKPPEKPRPLALVHAEARLSAESSRAIIVARKLTVAALIPYVRPGVDLVVSTAADELGPAGSLATAVAKLGPQDRVLVCPVDTLPASAKTAKALLERLGAGDAPPLAARPVHGGHGGHPVAIKASALLRYQQANPPPLRDYLRSLGEACVNVDVGDAEVLVDLDTPAQAVRYLKGPPTFLSEGR